MNDVNKKGMSALNDLAAMMRILGNLYYRHPLDSDLKGLYQILLDGAIVTIWPLKQEEHFKRIQKNTLDKIAQSYEALFLSSGHPVSLVLELDEQTQARLKEIMLATKMPILNETQSMHYGFLWLLLAWIESLSDQIRDKVADEQAQDASTISESDLLLEYLDYVFFEVIQPASARLLGQIETYSQNDFYKVLAIITREIVEEVAIELTHQTTLPDNS